MIRDIEQCQGSYAQVQASLREAREDQQWYASLDSTRSTWERLCQAAAAQGRLDPEDSSSSGLLAQAGAIRELQLRLDTYLSVAASIPALWAEADAIRADHRRLLGELGVGWNESAVAAFDTSPGVDETMRQMRKSRDALAGAVERAQEVLRAREEAVEAATRQHDRLKQELHRSRKPDYPDRAAIEARMVRIGRCQALLMSVARLAPRLRLPGNGPAILPAKLPSALRLQQAQGFAQVWLAPVLIASGRYWRLYMKPAWAASLLIAVGAARRGRYCGTPCAGRGPPIR